MAGKRRPQPRGEQVVKKIYGVTIAELARLGLARLSVPEVARLAGVNKTSVYRRWPTKEALVKAALSQSMEHARALEDTGSFETDLAALIRRVVAFVDSPRGSAVVRTTFLGSDRALRRHADQAWADAAGAGPEAVVSRAIERGELSPRADVSTLLFTVAGAILHRRFVEQALCDDAWVARVTSLVLHGVTARPGAARPSSARGRSPTRPARASPRGRRRPPMA